MLSQAETIRQNIHDNAERDARQQMGNFGEKPPAEIANGIPASNDATLAAHLQDMRNKNAEYAMLRTEEARQQWEAIAADNWRRTQANQAEISNKAAIETMNRATRDRAEGERLFSQLDATLRSTPTDKLQGNAEDAYRIPLDKLKDIANAGQKLFDLTGQDIFAPQQPQRTNPRLNPQPFPDGKLYQLENLPGGNLKIKLATGEEFTGDPISVTQKLAESKVNTAVWAGQKIQEAQQAQPSGQQPYRGTETITNQPTAQSSGDSLADDLAARQADALARQFGFSDKNEMMQWGQTVNQKVAKVAEFEGLSLAAHFSMACPDFPSTNESIETIMQIIDSNGWQTNLDSMQAAHALAIRNGLYQPLTAEQIQIANGGAPQGNGRQTPPPMLRTNNPEITTQTPNPYDMPMNDLRRAAIRQELDRSGPTYR